MIIKICKIHGPLSESNCYIHKHGPRKNVKARICYECASCVKERMKSPRYRQKQNIARNKRYEINPIPSRSFQKERRKSKGDVIRLRAKNQRLKIRLEAIHHYSNGTSCCVHCGESEIRFLALDHINDDGKAHRLLTGSDMHMWAKRNNWPSIFQVLCHNCNHLKFLNSRPRGESRSMKWLRKLRHEVLKYYSNPPKCAECDISNIEVLTIDHINDDGAEHRRKFKIKNLYRWLKKNDYPPGFQILCQNHNIGKEISRR